MLDQQQELIREADRQYLRYTLADGVEELLSGIDLFLMGLALAAITLSLRGAVDSGWFMVGALLASLLFAVVRGRLKERIRRRVTYPRLGYLSEELGEPVSRRRKWLIVLLLAPLAIVPVLFPVLLLTGNLPDLATAARLGRWAPAVFGVLSGAGIMWDSRRTGLQRLQVSGLFVAIAGVAASLLSADFLMAFALFCGGWGLVNAVSGSLALRRLTAEPIDSEIP